MPRRPPHAAVIRRPEVKGVAAWRPLRISCGSFEQDGACMATRIKSTSRQLYEQDFYAWSKAQAELLRAGRYADLDLEHLIEEVDDLGDSLYRSARSRIRTIIEHLLKLQYSPAQDPRVGWVETMMTQRTTAPPSSCSWERNVSQNTVERTREAEHTLTDAASPARRRQVGEWRSRRSRLRGATTCSRLWGIANR
jgi:hypothetical protein